MIHKLLFLIDSLFCSNAASCDTIEFLLRSCEAGEACVFLSVRELEVKTVRFEETLAPGRLDFELEDVKQAGPLSATGTAELVSAAEEILIAGRLHVEMTGHCDRCLEPLSLPVACEFDLSYLPVDEAGDKPEAEIRTGDTEIGYYQGNGLELNDVLREQLLLSIPMQKLCREDCLGICPHCGQNRNLAICACRVDAADDRWAALKDLIRN